MNIDIVVTKGKRKAVIPITDKEVGALFDIGWFMIIDGAKWLKLNKIDDETGSVFNKIFHLRNDVLDEGRCHQVISKGNEPWETKLCKDRWYLVAKPRWDGKRYNPKPTKADARHIIGHNDSPVKKISKSKMSVRKL